MGTSYLVFGLYRDLVYPGRVPNVVPERFLKEFRDRNAACFGCPIHCSHEFSVKSGPYKGTKGEGMEANTYIFATLMSDTDDMAYLCKYDVLHDQLGMHVDHFGTAYNWAMELYRDGLITKEDTGGIEITPGNQEAQLKLIEMMAKREGFGKVLDDFPLQAFVDRIPGAEVYIGHNKRAIPYFDRKGIIGSAIWTLAISIAPRGQDHLYGARDISMLLWPKEEVEKAGKEQYGDPEAFTRLWGYSPDKGHQVYDCENVFALPDQTGICKFASELVSGKEGVHAEDFAKLLSALTGVDFTTEDVLASGQREMLIARAFNAREGIRRIDDYPYAYRWLLEHKERHPKINYGSICISLHKHIKPLVVIHLWAH